MTETERQIGLELSAGQYSARKAKSDLKRLTSGEYRLEGDTDKGYEIWKENKKVRAQHRDSLRKMIIDVISLSRCAGE